jgi:basic membrane protein A and related proteins
MNVPILSSIRQRTRPRRMAGLLIPAILLGVLFWAGTISLASPAAISVGLVIDGPEVNDGAFNQLSYEGLQRAETDLGVTGTVYTSSMPADYGAQLQQCVDDGNALCISVGFLMAEATWNAAQGNPGTDFAIVDASWEEEYPGNLRGLVFAEDEVGYLAGTLAGLMTGSDVVADIGGMPIPPVDAFVYGYRNGARCANLDVQVLISYTFDFANPGLGAQVAQDLMDEGADVVFAPAGATGNGAVLTATQSGAWGIGVDLDQYVTVFDNGTVAGADKLLTSAMKNLDNAVYDTIAAADAGGFTPGTVRYDLAANGVSLAPFHDADAAIPTAVKDALVDVRQDIIDGIVDVWDPCWVNTPYVDGSSGSDDTDCLDPDQPCATIGYAIGQAQPDDVIRIAGGTYVENLAIDRPLTLEGGYAGQGGGAARTTAAIDWARDPGLYETIIDGSAAPVVAGDWDGRAVRKVSVLRDETELKMWYDGLDVFSAVQIGLATSNDGRVWDKYEFNPVLSGDPGAWDGASQEHAPFVLKEGETYKMWYEGANEEGVRQLGYATSDDGITWTKYGATPVLEAGPEAYDEKAAAHGTVLHEDSTYWLWYHAMGNQGAIIAYATSPDGVNWTKQGTALLPRPGEWDEGAVWGPSVLEFSGQYWMWYAAAGPSGLAIGAATSPDLVNWSPGTTPVLTDANPIGDPHVIQDEGKLKMWYTDFAENTVKYVESPDGVTWTDPAPLKGETALTPGALGDTGMPPVTLYAGPVVLDGLTITGGSALQAGAVDAGEHDLTVRGCVIRNNHSYADPDAWASAGILGGAPLTVVDSYFLDNEAGNAASALRPGGDLTVVNSLFAGNVGDAAIHGNRGISLFNVTLADNQSDVIFNPEGEASLEMTNSVVWGNLYESLRPSCDMVDCAVNYSDVEGGWPTGMGNLDLDPRFVGGGDYRLDLDSPCIDAGTAAGAPAYDLDGRMRDAAPDMGAYEWPPYRTFLPFVVR